MIAIRLPAQGDRRASSMPLQEFTNEPDPGKPVAGEENPESYPTPAANRGLVSAREMAGGVLSVRVEPFGVFKGFAKKRGNEPAHGEFSPWVPALITGLTV